MATRATTDVLWTGIGNVPAEVQGWFDQALLDYLPADFLYMGYGERRDIPGNSGRTINLERPNMLTASTTAVDEYVTPAGQQFSTTSISATVSWYGTHVPFSDRAVQVGLIRNLLSKVKEILAVHKKDTMDQLTRDALCTGSSAYYCSTAATTDITGPRSAVDCVIDKHALDYVVAQLVAADAKPITQRIEPSTGVGSKALNPAFVGFIHWESYPDLRSACRATNDDWTDVADYPSHQGLLPGEVGTYRGAGRNVRFVASTNGKIITGTSAGGNQSLKETTSGYTDVYFTLIMAEKAYIETAINGRSNGVIVQPLGSSGSADPMKQRGSIAWHDPYVATVVDSARIWRIEHGITA